MQRLAIECRNAWNREAKNYANVSQKQLKAAHEADDEWHLYSKSLNTKLQLLNLLNKEGEYDFC